MAKDLEAKIGAEKLERNKRAVVISHLDQRESQIEFVAAEKVVVEVTNLLRNQYIGNEITLDEYLKLLRVVGEGHFKQVVLPNLLTMLNFSP